MPPPCVWFIQLPAHIIGTFHCDFSNVPCRQLVSIIVQNLQIPQRRIKPPGRIKILRYSSPKKPKPQALVSVMHHPVAVWVCGKLVLNLLTYADGRLAPPAAKNSSQLSVVCILLAASIKSADCVATPRKRVTRSSAFHLAGRSSFAPVARLKRKLGWVAVT